jgi:hypothetical protein
VQKASGTRVTVEQRAVAEAEFLDDGMGAFPRQEAGLDRVAVLVIANPALTPVAKQGSRGRFVSAPSAEDSGEVHVRSWALEKCPTHVNLLVIICQQLKTCQSGHENGPRGLITQFQNGKTSTETTHGKVPISRGTLKRESFRLSERTGFSITQMGTNGFSMASVHTI